MAWKGEPGSQVADLTFDEVLPKWYQVKTHWFNGNALPAFFHMMNMGTAAESNVAHVANGGVEELRASKSISAGDELVLQYCESCDNEMMLSQWGVYLETNDIKLNDLHDVNCLISWANNPPAAATATSLKEAAVSILDATSRGMA